MRKKIDRERGKAEILNTFFPNGVGNLNVVDRTATGGVLQEKVFLEISQNS